MVMYLKVDQSILPIPKLHIDYQSSQCQTEIRIQYPESDNGTFGYFAIKKTKFQISHIYGLLSSDSYEVSSILLSASQLKIFLLPINLLRYSVRIDLSSSLSLTFTTVFSHLNNCTAISIRILSDLFHCSMKNLC